MANACSIGFARPDCRRWSKRGRLSTRCGCRDGDHGADGVPESPCTGINFVGSRYALQ